MASPENGNPENLRCQTFLITLSPKSDIEDETVQSFTRYIKKKTQFAYIVTEFGTNGKKHLHCCCVWSMPIDKRNIHDYWSKILVKDYPGSIGRYAVKVTVQYNHDWYDEYLRKGGDVVLDTYERDSVTRFFPSAEQQSRLVELKGQPEVRLHISLEMCSEWQDKDPIDASYESAIRYMNHRMFVEKRGPFIVDPRKQQQLGWFIYRMRNQIVEPSVSDRNFANQMTGNSMIQNF